MSAIFFFFNDPATTEIYTLSLHDALPIYLLSHRTLLVRPSACAPAPDGARHSRGRAGGTGSWSARPRRPRSEEHTSELQSRLHLVCRLLLEKKKTTESRPQPHHPITQPPY